MLGPEASEELMQALSARYGLDKPLREQYMSWLVNILQGDWGDSIMSGRSVTAEIADRFAATLALATVALMLSIVVTIPLGIVAAYKRNTSLDYILLSTAAIGQAVPSFVLAIFLIVVFGVVLKVLPTSGAPNLLRHPVEAVPYYIMPVASLALPRIAAFGRLLRASMLDVLSEPYIVTAKAKGLRVSAVLVGHALKNALIPLITMIMINYSSLLGGAVVTESIFGIPGIGRLLIRAVQMRDFPLIQGIMLCVAAMFIIGNLAADIMYSMVDPRIRY